MYLFLVPLVLGFACNLASALTFVFSRWWGERRGSMVSVILRDVLGIPIWAIGFALAVRTSSPMLFTPTPVTEVLGWLSIIVGGAIILMALVSIRLRSVRPSTRDTLAQSGLYARVRHPIHTGTLFEFVGLLVVIPAQMVALACAIGIVWVLIQTRFEEFDLLQRLPGYRAYMDRVPRFLPRL